MGIELNLSMLNLTQEVGIVIDLGVKLGFRDGCVSLPFTVKDNVLKFKVFTLAPQEATAIHILSTKPTEGVLKIQSLNLSRSEIVKGENLEINVTVVNTLTQNVISDANVTACVDGLIIKGNEIRNGKYMITVEASKFNAGTIRAIIVVEKEGYSSDLKETYFILKESPPTFPYQIFAVILFVIIVSVCYTRYWIRTRTKQLTKLSKL